jgi:uncharacterized protein (TIGR00369 family)
MRDIREDLIKIYEQTNQFGNQLGMVLTKFDKEIEYRLEITDQHLATPTTAHGGVIAAYMDGIIGVAALYVSAENGNLVSTVEFKINYFSPVRLGDVLIGNGMVISSGKRIIVAEGKIIDQKTGNVVAKAMGTFNAYPYQKSGMRADFEQNK